MITQEQRDELLTLIVGTFGAAPTAEIMQQLEDGLDQGATLEQYAQSFINSEEFASLYESPEAFARQLLGDSISDDALAEASSFLMNSIANGANVGDLLLTSINAIKNVPADDPVWSVATKQLTNKKAVAEVFIERTAAQVPATDNDATDNQEDTDTVEETPVVMDIAAMRAVLRSVTEDETTVAVVREVINSGSQKLFNPEVEVLDIVEELGLEVPELANVESEEPEVEEEPEVVTSPPPSTPTPQPAEPTIHELIADYVTFSTTLAGDILTEAAELDLQNDLDGEELLSTESEEYAAALSAYSFDEFDAEVALTAYVLGNYVNAEWELSNAIEASYAGVNLEGYEDSIDGSIEAIGQFLEDAQTNVNDSTNQYSFDGELVVDSDGVVASDYRAVYQFDGEYTLTENESGIIGYIRQPFTLADQYVSAKTDFRTVWYGAGEADSDTTINPEDSVWGNDASIHGLWTFYLSSDLNGVLEIDDKSFYVTEGLIFSEVEGDFAGNISYSTDDVTDVSSLMYNYYWDEYKLLSDMFVDGNSKTPADISGLEIVFTPSLTSENIIEVGNTTSVFDLQTQYTDSIQALDSDFNDYGSNRALIDALVASFGELDGSYSLGSFVTVDYVQEELAKIDSDNSDFSREFDTNWLLEIIDRHAETEALDRPQAVSDALSDIYYRQDLINSLEISQLRFLSTEEGSIYGLADTLMTERETLIDLYGQAEELYFEDQNYIDSFLSLKTEFSEATDSLKSIYKDVIYLNVDMEVDLVANDELDFEGPADLLVYSTDQDATSVINNFGIYDDLYLGTDIIFHRLAGDDNSTDASSISDVINPTEPAVDTSESSSSTESTEVSTADVALAWIQENAGTFSTSQIDAFAFSDNGTGYIWVEQAADSVSSTVMADSFNQITFTGVEADSMIMTDGFLYLA